MPLIAGRVSCKKCGTQRYKQQAYMNWHNVDCFVTIFKFTFIRNWWICTGCAKKAGLSDYRYHDIDGHWWHLTKKFPYIRRD